MSFLRFLSCAAIAFACTTVHVRAQVEAVGGGCTVPSGGPVPAVLTNEENVPVLGNLEFRVNFRCPEGADSVFILYGACASGPEMPTFPESPCGAGCGRVVEPSGMRLEGRDLPADGGGVVSLALGLPNIPSLSGTELCVQFLCFDLSGPQPVCRGISQGAKITFL
ncbi:MAG: hypothetical protein KDB80_07670 [Planctomycetes bacterium]|nr:hypothetical protein [Planctomycetota bacterium]